MKKVFRFEINQDYWDRRWNEAGKDNEGFTDLNIYPIRYAQMVMIDTKTKTLEIGCGLGRVLKHYHNQGFQISGLERSQVAVNAMKATNPNLDVKIGDALDLPYDDNSFDTIMAFGVYHNIEDGIDQGLAEVARCLKPSGRFCISMRPDNLEMRFNERYWAWKQRSKGVSTRYFHRYLVGQGEFRKMLDVHGLDTYSIHYARNVSILWRLPFLKARQNEVTEGDRRSHGYRLNLLGRSIDRLLMATIPAQTCNVLVFVGSKNTGGVTE